MSSPLVRFSIVVLLVAEAQAKGTDHYLRKGVSQYELASILAGEHLAESQVWTISKNTAPFFLQKSGVPEYHSFACTIRQFFFARYSRNDSFLKYRACKLGLMFLVSAVVSLKSKAAVSTNLWRSRRQVG